MSINAARSLSRRADDTGRVISIVSLVAIALLLTAIVVSYAILRRLRAKNHGPKLLPGKYLKRKWQQWQPVGKYATVNSAERGERQSLSMTNTEYRGRGDSSAQNDGTAATAAAGGVDRNTSVRSVMSLPPYSQTPKETEQVIGREGERAGMDTVVEFPETAEEEETARESEMSSLYQIRQARRREIAEREERRRQRREARDRGDWARLEELRRESRLRADSTNSGSTASATADSLIAEHQSRPKDRRVSSVAYANLGQVRHDGTRVRNGSVESERGALLDGAAPMAEHHRNDSESNSIFTMNNLSRPSLPFAGRHRSDSGGLSISSRGSSFDNQTIRVPTGESSQPRSSGSSMHRDPRESTDDITEERPIDPRIVSMIRDSDNDVIRPPNYDTHDWGDAPAYEEQVRRAESQRVMREHQSRMAAAMRASGDPLNVPSINVQVPSEPNTPVIGADPEERYERR